MIGQKCREMRDLGVKRKMKRTRKIDFRDYNLKLMKEIFLTFSIVLPSKLEEVRWSPAPEKRVGKGKKEWRW